MRTVSGWAIDGRLVTHPQLAEAGWRSTCWASVSETIVDLLFVTHRMIRRVGDVYVDVLHERLSSSVTDPGAQEVQAIRGVFEEAHPHAVQIMTTLFDGAQGGRAVPRADDPWAPPPPLTPSRGLAARGRLDDDLDLDRGGVRGAAPRHRRRARGRPASTSPPSSSLAPLMSDAPARR